MAKRMEPIITLLPTHFINEIVYAVSFTNDSVDNAETAQKVDEWDRDYARIYKVRVVSIYITADGIQYLVKDLNTGKEWGDDVPEEQIGKTPNDLFNCLAERWKL